MGVIDDILRSEEDKDPPCVCEHSLLCHEALYGECIVPECDCKEFKEEFDAERRWAEPRNQ